MRIITEMNTIPSIDQLRQLAVDIAEGYVGQREKKNNGGFLNANFEKKMRSIGFQTGHAWCAYFTELIWVEAYTAVNPSMLPHLKKLFSGSVMATRNNFRSETAKSLGFMFSSTAKPGDLAVWQSRANKTQGHIAIVTEAVTDKTKLFSTIEGNTNSAGGREGIEVARKCRKYAIGESASLILLGFITMAVIPESHKNITTITKTEA